jgi:hypothetical protein
MRALVGTAAGARKGLLVREGDILEATLQVTVMAACSPSVAVIKLPVAKAGGKE